MNLILKKRNFLTHILLFIFTGGIWLFVYIIAFILHNKKLQKEKYKLYNKVVNRECIQDELDVLELEIKREKLKEIRLKNEKLEK